MINKAHYDKWLLLVTFILVGLGTLMVYSSTSVITPVFARRNISAFFYLKRHVFTIGVGAVFMYLASQVKIETLKKMALPLLAFSFVLLALVFVPGIGISAGGARRWIKLWPSTFQPSEMVKLAMVLSLAHYLSMERYRNDSLRSFIIPISVMGLFQLVFLKQPDFGATMSLGLLTIAMLILAGARMRYVMSLVVLVVPVIIKLLMEPYRFRRILSFLHPWDDAQGAGFQLTQSFIALGSGGLTGVGLGNSRQKLSFLPESHTDFIFSLVGEELGFIAALAIVGLFVFVFLRGIRIANRTKNMFSYYLASGLSMMIALQALVNFYVATGLAPTKGLPLPFISYGGSSLLINMTAVGLLLNLSKEKSGTTDIDKTMESAGREKTLTAIQGRKRRYSRLGVVRFSSDSANGMKR